MFTLIQSLGISQSNLAKLDIWYLVPSLAYSSMCVASIEASSETAHSVHVSQYS